MRNYISILAALLIVSFVAACGQKGPLRLPPAPAKPTSTPLPPIAPPAPEAAPPLGSVPTPAPTSTPAPAKSGAVTMDLAQ